MSNKISSERIGEYTCPDCNQSMCLTQDNLRNHKCMKKLDVNNHGVLMSWRKEIRKKVKDWDKNYTGQDKDYQTYIKNMFLNAYENKLDEYEKQNKQLKTRISVIINAMKAVITSAENNLIEE